VRAALRAALGASEDADLRRAAERSLRKLEAGAAAEGDA
jgi:hypothetical protein